MKKIIALLLSLLTLTACTRIVKVEDVKVAEDEWEKCASYYLCHSCRFSAWCGYVYVPCVGTNHLGYTCRFAWHHYADCSHSNH